MKMGKERRKEGRKNKNKGKWKKFCVGVGRDLHNSSSSSSSLPSLLIVWKQRFRERLYGYTY